MSEGFICPFCGTEKTQCKDTRSTRGGTRRRRHCHKCARRFTTFEVVAASIDSASLSLASSRALAMLDEAQARTKAASDLLRQASRLDEALLSSRLDEALR